MLNIKKATTFSAHRSGWAYVMNHLMRFNSFGNIMLDDFVDITFGYKYQENLIKGVIPYSEPWVGFIHHPPKICPWYEDSYKNQIDIHTYMNTYEFHESMEKCEGIFVLSDYLKEYLKSKFPVFKNVPIFSIKHPTSFEDLLLWDYNKFKASGGRGTRVITVGYFLRCLSTIFTARFSNKRVERLLMPSSLPYAVKNLDNEIKYKHLDIDKSLVKIIDWQNHRFYDKALEQSILLLNLYDTSCNNAIIESVVRNTPMLINRHPAIQEYLGDKYPLYTNFNQPISINNEIIYETSKYLKQLDKTELSIEHFCEKFKSNVNNIIGKSKKSKKTIKKNIKQKNILCNTSSFNHRFGWPFVTREIKKHFESKHKSKAVDVYLNDFTEHVFKNFFADNTKYIGIEGKNYSGVRGKTLLNFQGSDVFVKDNIMYMWSQDRWVEQSLTSKKSKAIAFSKHSTYIDNPWIGMFHNPIKMPNWFGYSQNINSIIKKEEFIEALDTCLCMITFSPKQKNELQQVFEKNKLKHPAIKNMKHPIHNINPSKYFNPKLYLENKKVFQIGYWQRNIHRFLTNEFEGHDKYLFFSDPYCAEILKLEHMVSKLSNRISKKTIDQICKIIVEYEKPTLINKNIIIKTDKAQYDKYLKSGIIFSEYYDVSASNTILESIMYKTPILTNRHVASEYYLGKKYPMFYDHPNQIEKMLRDENLIIETHEYLKKLNVEDLQIDFFLNKLDGIVGAL